MKINSMTIDGVEYDVVKSESGFRCPECDLYDWDDNECSFGREVYDYICPLSNEKCSSVLKKRNVK